MARSGAIRSDLESGLGAGQMAGHAARWRCLINNHQQQQHLRDRDRDRDADGDGDGDGDGG